MQLSVFWEDIACAATEEFSNILWNPKDHYRVHKSPPLLHNLSQIGPVHTTPSYLRSIIKLSTHLRLGFLVNSFPLAFPPIAYMHSSFPPFMLHILAISSSLTWSFYYVFSSINNWVGVVLHLFPWERQVISSVLLTPIRLTWDLRLLREWLEIEVFWYGALCDRWIL
jgi:hypothetical protein